MESREGGGIRRLHRLDFEEECLWEGIGSGRCVVLGSDSGSGERSILVGGSRRMGVQWGRGRVGRGGGGGRWTPLPLSLPLFVKFTLEESKV